MITNKCSTYGSKNSEKHLKKSNREVRRNPCQIQTPNLKFQVLRVITIVQSRMSVKIQMETIHSSFNSKWTTRTPVSYSVKNPISLTGVGFLFEGVQGINLIVESRSSESKWPRSIWNRPRPLMFTFQVVTNNAKPRLVGLRWTLVNSISRRNHHSKLVGIVGVGVDASEENQNSSKTWKTSTKWS